MVSFDHSILDNIQEVILLSSNRKKAFIVINISGIGALLVF